MKLDRQIWLKIESRGKPQLNTLREMTAKEAVLMIGQFVATESLHSKFTFSIAADPQLLNKETQASEMSLDLEAILDGDYGSDD